LTFSATEIFLSATHIFSSLFFFRGKNILHAYFSPYVPYIIAFALKFLHTGKQKKKKTFRDRVLRHRHENKNILQVHDTLRFAFCFAKKTLIRKLLSQHVIVPGEKKGEREFRAPKRFLLKKSIARKFDTCFLCKLFPYIQKVIVLVCVSFSPVEFLRR
jgi:hypothetical protein